LALPQGAVGKVLERTLATDGLVHARRDEGAVAHLAEEGHVRRGEDAPLDRERAPLEERERGVAVETGHANSVRPILRRVKRVAVIGAGAAGLVSARWLAHDGLEPVIFERTHGIGGIWRPDTGLAYPSLRTNTSKQKSAFSDLPFADALPDHPFRDDVQAYLERYADVTGVRSRISFGHDVRAVRPRERGWSVDGEPFDSVVVASGLFARAVEPPLPGRDRFGGLVIHSRDYRDPTVF